MACIGDCFDLGPPPDSIMSMPPPPLPSFLLPRSAIVALSGNDSQPCFAPYMCEPNPGPREQSGIEFIELSRKGPLGGEDTWLLVLVSSCVGVLLLGALLAMILMKCRESYNYSYHETSLKQPPLSALGEPHHLGTAKQHNFMSGTMLYPCNQSSNNHLQQQLANDNRVLWAALTPHGTQHFVSEAYPSQDDHYEVIDYGLKVDQKYNTTTSKHSQVKSFENNGFVDYDYEDPTPLIESYHLDDMDSGYQEPQDIMGTGTLQRPRSPRPMVSSPTRIENPNIPPLNLYPNRNFNGTLNKKSTLSRRISDVSAYSNQNM